MEYRVEKLEEEVKGLKAKTDQMHEDLAMLINTLNSIKFWLYGVGSFYVINEAGIMPIIKKFLGV
jgi:hypothetical protein